MSPHGKKHKKDTRSREEKARAADPSAVAADRAEAAQGAAELPALQAFQGLQQPPMPPGMNPGQQNSNPKETRESGFDTVLIGDGGGTFQRYGGGSMDYYPQDNARAGRNEFSMDVPDKIVRYHTSIKEQIKDTGKKT